MSVVLLSALFFAVAVIYAMAGFGGGSSYIALLTLFGFSHEQIPVVALTCNLVAVSSAAYHFIRAGHFEWRRFWPWVVGSVPLALVGGRLPLTRGAFFGVLGVSLLVAGVLLVWPVRAPRDVRLPHRGWSLLLGSGLGLLSGLVGIGGGVFLAPLLLLLHWATPKQAAAFAAVFIWLNSAAGLAGQFGKHSWPAFHGPWLLLAVAVLVGGQLGSRWGAHHIPQERVRQLTGVIVLAAALRIVVDCLWR